MNMRIVFRHMDPVASIENYAHDAMRRVFDILSHERDPVTIDLTLEASKVHAHNRVELHIRSPHYDLITHHEGPEFYKELDHVIDVMVRLLHEQKRKEVDERKTRTKMSELPEEDTFDDEDLDFDFENDEDFED